MKNLFTKRNLQNKKFSTQLESIYDEFISEKIQSLFQSCLIVVVSVIVFARRRRHRCMVAMQTIPTTRQQVLIYSILCSFNIHFINALSLSLAHSFTRLMWLLRYLCIISENSHIDFYTIHSSLCLCLSLLIIAFDDR